MGAVVAWLASLPLWLWVLALAVVALLAFWFIFWKDPGAMASGVGQKKLPFPLPGHKVGRDWSQHKGWDIGAPPGTPIKNPALGTVRFAGSKPGKYGGLSSCGRYVEIYYARPGILVSFCHMQEEGAFRVGEQVKPGQILGYVGETGHAYSPHLHITVRRSGKVVDPGIYFPRS